jgi:hypothetical protein
LTDVCQQAKILSAEIRRFFLSTKASTSTSDI